jgi:hypothetical protein
MVYICIGMIIKVTDNKAVFRSFISEKTDNTMAKEKGEKDKR